MNELINIAINILLVLAWTALVGCITVRSERAD